MGIDDQVYYDDPTGKVVFSLPFRWNIYNGILSIDYGSDYPLFEIYDVYITGNKMSGILYVDGRIDGPIVLKRYGIKNGAFAPFFIQYLFYFFRNNFLKSAG